SSVRVLRPPHPSFGHLLPRFQSIPCHRRTGGEGPRPSPHSSCTTVLGEGAGNPLPKPTAVPSQCDVRRPCSGPLQTERRRPSDSRAVGLGGAFHVKRSPAVPGTTRHHRTFPHAPHRARVRLNCRCRTFGDCRVYRTPDLPTRAGGAAKNSAVPSTGRRQS